MQEYFSDSKKDITNFLKNFLESKKEYYKTVSTLLGLDVSDRLFNYTESGKMLRGSLVKLGYELVSKTTSNETKQILIQAGAAMELFESALLIHDDIMDRDTIRRGKNTVHVDYQNCLANNNYSDCAHNGSALAICLGDIAYFASFELLSSLRNSPSSKELVNVSCLENILQLASKELSFVGIAQMQDLLNGASNKNYSNTENLATNLFSNKEPTQEEILKLYKHKTARYTFTLPLLIGANIANASPDILKSIEEASENLGVLFQLKDDELGIFADSKQLGKVSGSDIKENKKTVLRYMLFNKIDAPTKIQVESIFGSTDISSADIGYIRTLIGLCGIMEDYEELMQNYADKASKIAEAFLPQSNENAKNVFTNLLSYSLTRCF